MAILSLPAGFIEQHVGKRLWWIKADWAPTLQHAVVQTINGPVFFHSELRLPPPSGGTPNIMTALGGGRGTVHRIALDPRTALIVRSYRRGGFVRHFIRDLYWDHPPRPFAELCCTEEARQRGVPTVEVLGAQVERVLGPLYRGLLVTREATGFHNLWVWLQTGPPADLRRITLSVAAQAIAAMHQAGVAHADLNPTNILVHPDSDPPQALIIDFDRARLFSGLVPVHIREANFRRFQRFFGNYDVLEKWLSPADFEHFRQVYRIALSK